MAMRTQVPREGDLQVWWIPQVPMKAFTVPVATPEEARKILDVLADYDLFQLRNNVKPDYCNAGGLNMFEDGEWVEWYNEDGDDIDSAFSDPNAVPPAPAGSAARSSAGTACG